MTTGRQLFNECVKDICDGVISLEDLPLSTREQIMSQGNLILTAVKFAKKTKVQQAVLIAGFKRNIKTACVQPTWRKRGHKGKGTCLKKFERKMDKVQTRYNSFGLQFSLMAWIDFLDLHMSVLC